MHGLASSGYYYLDGAAVVFLQSVDSRDQLQEWGSGYAAGDDDDRRPRGELSAACSSITPRGNAAATNSRSAAIGIIGSVRFAV